MSEKLNVSTEILNDPHWEYTGKPIILGEAGNVIEQGMVHWTRKGNAKVRLPTGETVSLAPEHQLDLVNQSFESVEANLQPGTEYEEFLQKERTRYDSAKLKADSSNNPHRLKYGTLIYYPQYPRLAWVAPKSIKHLALLARNEFQLQDPNQKLSYDDQRRIFGSQIIGFFGASVNSLAAHRLVDTLRPNSIDIIHPQSEIKGGIKIGDFDVYNDAVRGRRRHGLIAVDHNKAVVTAQEMQEADPWLPVWVYPEGIDPYSNFDQFVHGNSTLGEPAIGVGVEAIDRVDDKFEITRRLRDNGIDNWRISDIGSAYQVEWLPNSRIKNYPLTIGVSDSDLEMALDQANRHSSKENWFNFAFKLIGPHWERIPEFKDFIQDKIRSPFASAIPQLGLAAEGAANLVALGIASTSLGWEWPNRYFVDLRTGTLIREWLDVENNRLKRETTEQHTGIMSIEHMDLNSGKILDSITCHIYSGQVVRYP